MRGILAVLSVNVARAKGRPWYVVMTASFMVAAIVVAVLVSTKIDGRGTVAYVPRVTEGVATGAALDAIDQHLDGLVRVEALEEAPPMSLLMRNRYDAVIIDEGGGRFDILTVKGDAFRMQLAALLTGTKAGAEFGAPSRGVGTTIVGYLVMFMLISGSTYMNFFTDDKQLGTFRRTATSPVGIGSYLAGQLLFNGLMLFVPAMTILVLLKQLFGMDIGFSFGQYALLLALLTGLATAFGFLIAAVIENPDDGMAVASSTIIVTSLLAGSFFAFEHEDAVMQFATGLLPQKGLLDLASILERVVTVGPGTSGVSGSVLGEMAGPVLHVVAVALIMCAAGWAVCARRFRAGSY